MFGSLAMLAAMRRASSRVISFAAVRRPDSGRGTGRLSIAPLIASVSIRQYSIGILALLRELPSKNRCIELHGFLGLLSLDLKILYVVHIDNILV